MQALWRRSRPRAERIAQPVQEGAGAAAKGPEARATWPEGRQRGMLRKAESEGKMEAKPREKAEVAV
jgi:hypothetical protein